MLTLMPRKYLWDFSEEDICLLDSASLTPQTWFLHLYLRLVAGSHTVPEKCAAVMNMLTSFWWMSIAFVHNTLHHVSQAGANPSFPHTEI